MHAEQLKLAVHKVRSAEAIFAAAEEFEDAEVAEDLELLADFVADVAIGRMQAGQFPFRSAKSNSRLPNVGADCGRRDGLPISNDFDSSV